jgi:hypothetical protein
MQAISGAPYTLTVEYFQGGEYVVPDEGSVSYTLYDNSGAAIVAQTDVAVATDNTSQQSQITISGTYHTIAGGKSFEQRTLRVKYKRDGKDYTTEQWYYVTGNLNLRVRPQEVLLLLGIREGEALLEEVDLVQAYFKVSSALGSTVFGTALSSGGITQIKVNEAVKITAALDLAAVIELKAFRKFGNELNYSRFEKIDFAGIRATLKSNLADALSAATNVVSTAPSLFTVTQPVDPLTGV